MLRTRLIISEFSLGSRRYTGKTFAYLMDAPGNAIGDFTALTDREYIIIERDGGQGDADGNLIKEEVADLMNIYDPRDVAGNGRTNTVFTFPFVTIEDVLVLDNTRLLVINDNNYPGSAGRESGVSDNNEFIVIHVAPLLECESGEDHRKPGKLRRKHHDFNECELARD